MSSLEQRLEDHLKQQAQFHEHTFCVVCEQIVYLHDQDTYVSHPAGVMCKPCANAQHLSNWFDERVANGIDPVEAARDADAAFMSHEEWQEHWHVFYGVLAPR